jgi:predicted DNA-binding protein
MSLVALRLNKETIEDLDEVAEECNWSRSKVIKRAIGLYLKEYADSDIAAFRIKRKETSRPLIEVMKELGLLAENEEEKVEVRGRDNTERRERPKENRSRTSQTDI